jgi:hypothetical protein
MKKGKTVLKILAGIILFALLIKLFTSLFLESVVKDKIQSALNKTSNKYTIEIGKVHIHFLPVGIEIKSIAIYTDPSIDTYGDLNGKISFVRISGIHLLKAVFHHDYHFNRLTISEPAIVGRIPFPRHVTAVVLSPFNLRIDLASFEKAGLDLLNKSDSKAYRLKNGNLKMYNFHILKKDTLSQRIIGQFHFQSEEIQAVTSDSIYTITGKGIIYSALSNTLEIKDFSIMPNFSDSKFMARFKYETDRIEARFKDMYIHDFPAVDYVESGSISSSYLKIGVMDIKVYRDKRKKFRHTIKPAFQEIIYNYHAPLKIDSIGILNGNVVYTLMVDNSKARGRITFSNIRASIYKVTNDSAYKVKEDFLRLKAEGMFMDKSKIKVMLKARLFDNQNTFTMSGNLSDLELKAINPMLENSAFVVVTAGKIDTMSFNFAANNAKANGKMRLLYHGLAVTVVNMETGDSSGIKQKLITFIANRKLIDANPLPGKEIREGIIDHERDPEKFLFSYCFRSMFSGIRTTLLKNPKEEKKPKD